MKQPRLIAPGATQLSTVTLQELFFIINSKGRKGHLCFSILCKIDTKTNNTKILYWVTAFEKVQEDYVSFETENYDEAVIKYNKLATEFNGYRFDS